MAMFLKQKDDETSSHNNTCKEIITHPQLLQQTIFNTLNTMSLPRRLGFPSNSIVDGFDDFFAPASISEFAAVPFLTNQNRSPDIVLRRSSPCMR